MNKRGQFCDNVSRRSFLRVGSAGAFGASWSLSGLLQQQASGFDAQTVDERSLIIVFLKGGLSTIDTFDMKPDAPAEVRGEFDPISTNVAGTQVCNHLPLVSRQMDKFSLIRSCTHTISEHGKADHYLLTGYAPTPAFKASLKPNNERPSMGAVISKKLGARGSVPSYVCLPDMHNSGGASFLGPAAAPLSINADPNDPGFTIRDVVPPMDLDASRLDNRNELLATVDRYQRSAEATVNNSLQSLNEFRERAFSLMTSAEAKQAFNIHSEPSSVRDEYGRNSLGQSCLMARRLVSAGVRCVLVSHIGWDTHLNNFQNLKNDLLPNLDAAMAMLYKDLADRGMLDSTMVLVTGEFGRTPQINDKAGRDHWGPCFTAMLGGGGVAGGQILGASDKTAAKPAERPVSPEDLAATIHHQLGINPEDEFITPEGRPIKIVNQGHVLHELV
ncbi:MAG: DUF1501 domain-containing protein [Planctomycetaceae bacterium]|nr:DUF1501 domain-containing protein [Planctomycetaceae bacterium]